MRRPFFCALEHPLHSIDRMQRVSWGAAMAGAVVATAVWLLLHLLAIGVGLSALGNDAGSLESIGVGTGVWSLLVPAVALFFGGLVAGRLAGVADRLSGALHGAVLWSVTTLFAFFLVVFAVTRIIGGVAQVAQVAQVVEAATPEKSPASSVAQIDLMGIDSRAVLAHVNARLAARRLPPLTAEQADTITSEITRRAMGGELTREGVLDEVVENTGLPREQVDDVAREIESDMEASGMRPLEYARSLATRTVTEPQAGARAEVPPPVQRNERAKDDSAIAAVAGNAGHALRWVSLALVLGLISAMLGAALGAGRTQLRNP